MKTSSCKLRFEDPLDYLPKRPIQEFSRGRVIYDSLQPSDNLYLVVSGRVKVTATTEYGRQTVLRIVQSGGIFGESALAVNKDRMSEQVLALENVSLMAWSAAEIEQQIERQPNLGIGLAQYVVERETELADRIENIAIYQTSDRVAIGLLQLAASLGETLPDGTTRIRSLIHSTIAEFVGTSREIVTFHMNRLRRLGLLQYSRRFIDVNVPAMEELLSSHGVTIPVLVRESYGCATQQKCKQRTMVD